MKRIGYNIIIYIRYINTYVLIGEFIVVCIVKKNIIIKNELLKKIVLLSRETFFILISV